MGAALLDGLFAALLGIGALAVAVAIDEAGNTALALPFYIVGGVIWLFYAPFLMQREGEANGQTWGKQIVGIRVVRNDGEPMGFGWAVLRELVIKTFLFGWVGGSILIGWLLDVLWPLWDDENRALHDMIASTHVVRA